MGALRARLHRWLEQVHGRLRARVQRDWRILRGRCIGCNATMDDRFPHRSEFYHRFPDPRKCRWCNKIGLHAENYGMGPQKLGETHARR